jgi:hypothetical protein
VSILRHNNKVIGAYVTAVARIHLYGYLDRLRENTNYCDTDLVIFNQPRTEPWPVATGVKFLELQSELKSLKSKLNL